MDENGEKPAMGAKLMKVAVTLEVLVDFEAWNAEYGSDETVKEVRDAVKGIIGTAAVSAFAHVPDAVRMVNWK